MFDTVVMDDVLVGENPKQAFDLIMNGPWSFLTDMSYNGRSHYGFSQVLTGTPLFEGVAVPILNAASLRTGIQIQQVLLARAFLQLPLVEKFRGENNGIHLDRHTEHIAGVYYLNDTDGDTILYDNTKYNTALNAKDVDLIIHEKVTPKAGRMVLFDGARYHCSSQPVTGLRAIINFNLTIR